eukprot:4602895-Alexandrium_andersonii.AAC.2
MAQQDVCQQPNLWAAVGTQGVQPLVDSGSRARRCLQTAVKWVGVPVELAMHSGTFQFAWLVVPVSAGVLHGMEHVKQTVQ